MVQNQRVQCKRGIKVGEKRSNMDCVCLFSLGGGVGTLKWKFSPFIGIQALQHLKINS